MNKKVVLIAVAAAVAVIALGVVASPKVREYLKEQREKKQRETFIADYVQTCAAVNPSEKRTRFCECLATEGAKRMVPEQLTNKVYVNQYIHREIAPGCGLALGLKRNPQDKPVS